MIKEELIPYCRYWKGESLPPSEDNIDGTRREYSAALWIEKALNYLNVNFDHKAIRKEMRVFEKNNSKLDIEELMGYIAYSIPLPLSIRKQKPFRGCCDSYNFYYSNDAEWKEELEHKNQRRKWPQLLHSNNQQRDIL